MSTGEISPPAVIDAVTPATRRWRSASIWLAVAAGAVLALYAGTFGSMVETWWHSETFAHGFLIAPISAWLVWRRRELLAAVTPRADPWFGVLLLAAVLLWMSSHLANVLVVQQFAAVTMLLAVIVMVLGRQVFFTMAFPLLYLYFAVPTGDFLVPLLQDITAWLTIGALQLTGVPVFWEGRYFSIPSGRFEVAEACSGLRYLIASFALGVLFAWLFYTRPWKRAAFIALSIVVPVIANGLRAYGIVMIADLSNYELATGIDHFIYGWVFFGIVMMLLFWIGLIFRDPVPGEDPDVKKGPRSSDPLHGRQERGWAMTLLAGSILVSGPALAAYLDRHSGVEAGALALEIPGQIDGWMTVDIGADAIRWRRPHPGASDEFGFAFEGGSGRIEFFMAHYGGQRQDSKLIQLNDRFVGDAWRTIRVSVATVRDAEGRLRPIRRIQIDHRNQRLLLFQWYVVDGQAFANPVLAKIHEARARLRAGTGASAMVMFAVEPGIDPEDADAIGEQFYRAIQPYVERAVRPAP